MHVVVKNLEEILKEILKKLNFVLFGKLLNW